VNSCTVRVPSLQVPRPRFAPVEALTGVRRDPVGCIGADDLARPFEVFEVGVRLAGSVQDVDTVEFAEQVGTDISGVHRARP